MNWPLALVTVAALAGCQDDIATPFPLGLPPFTDGDAPFDLAAVRDGTLQVHGTKDDAIRAYGRGFIAASPAAVWEVTRDPAVMIALCKTTRYELQRDNEDFPLSFLVHYVVEDFLTVEWDDQWRGDVILGTPAAPELVLIRHQKVHGSDFIRLSEGSVQLLATEDPALTEVLFVEHLDAISGSTDDVIQGMRHNFARMAAAVQQGAPIPGCARAVPGTIPP